MDPDPTTPQQAISSLANIAPFLWPFVLLSLGVALTPVSPISWSYSTWLLFIIPLTITVFAPIRSFSGPLRFAYLEYGLKIGSLVVSLLKGAALRFTEIPPLALPAFFFLPVLPLFFFILFPALPVAWHYVAYHYRKCLKAITTSVAKTNASLDLAIARARQAVALAQTFEKQALYTVSATRCTPSVDLSRHSTDFGAPVVNDSDGHLRLLHSPGTLGADLAGKVLDAEKQMAEIEDASQAIRESLEKAVAVATDGEMAAGKKLARNAADSLETVEKQVNRLRLTADQARCKWVDFRHRLSKVTTSASTTIASLDFALTQARRAATLAQTVEKQALYTVSTTRCTPLVGLSRQGTDFAPVLTDSNGHLQLIQGSGTLGADLAEKVLDAEKRMVEIEDASRVVRELSEEAVTVATEGNMVAGEELVGKAENSLKNVVEPRVEYLRWTADQARCTWVDFRRRLNKVTTSASTTMASLDIEVTQARRAAAQAHAYEDQALAFVSTTRRSASQTLALHDADFFESSTPVEQARDAISNDAESVRALGSTLAEHLLLVEAFIVDVEVEAGKIRALLEQAITAAVDGDVASGETLTNDAARSLGAVVDSVHKLSSVSDDARRVWVQLSVGYWTIP